jgi:tropomyosin
LNAVINAPWLRDSFNEADLKAEENERKNAKLEQDLAEKEKQYEELVEKFNASKAELEELSRQFEDL